VEHPETQQRLADLEKRLAALERAARTAAPEPARPHATAGDSPSGEVHYGGSVRLHGSVEWSIQYAADAVLDLPAGPCAEVLDALGHPIRGAMIRRLLTGPATVAELQEVTGVSSTGQLYHHLRTLTGARLVEQHGRGSYRAPPTAVVPALVLLLAAADIAGELRNGRPQPVVRPVPGPAGEH
jgi:ArsR family transcriptional regulator